MEWISIFFLIFIVRCDCMTLEQLKSAGKMAKKSCMSKNDATEAQVGKISEGVFIPDHEVKCYIACVYQMGQVVKNGKLSVDAAIKQVDMMYPAEMKEAMKLAISSCRNIPKKHKDICEASYAALKCIHDADPENFFFP